MAHGPTGSQTALDDVDVEGVDTGLFGARRYQTFDDEPIPSAGENVPGFGIVESVVDADGRSSLPLTETLARRGTTSAFER